MANNSWVKIADGLPPIPEGERASDRVLVYAEEEIMIANFTTWAPGGWVVEDDGNWPPEGITHWMPLPEKPDAA